MEEKDKKNILRTDFAKGFYFCAFFMLLFVFLNIVFSSVLFFAKVTISAQIPILSLILSLICCLIVIYFDGNFKIKKLYLIFFATILPILIIGFSIYFSGKIYDFSYDGNSYHKAAIGELKNGWNPVFEHSDDFDKSSSHPVNLQGNALWIDHYAKGSYIFAANIYALTNNIETGKSINIISIFILFFFVLALLLYKNKSILFSIVFSVCAITYPIISAQYMTNYVDLLLYIFLFLTLLNFFYFEFDGKDFIKKRLILFNYFMILVISINIKFTCFAYCGFFCLGYYIWYIIRFVNKKIDVKFFRKFTVVSIIAVIFGALVVGYGTYTKNIIEQKNPFYPLIGKNKVDIMTSNSPDYFKKKNSVEKFAISLFSEVSNITELSHTKAKLKIPFTISSEEITNLVSPDTRLSGNGVFYSGIFIISIIILICYLPKLFKKDKKLFWLCFIPIIITFILALLLQESWWARYFPQTYFIVLGSIITCEKMNTEWSNGFAFLLIGILLINNFLTFSISTGHAIESTKNANLNFFNMESQNCKYELYNQSFPGAVYNIIDKFGYENILINSSDVPSDAVTYNSLNNFILWRCVE